MVLRDDENDKNDKNNEIKKQMMTSSKASWCWPFFPFFLPFLGVRRHRKEFFVLSILIEYIVVVLGIIKGGREGRKGGGI